MQELLETLARALVTQPGRVRVTRRGDDTNLRLELLVAPEDRGRVIGREGRTADSLRVLLDTAARHQGIRCDLEIVG